MTDFIRKKGEYLYMRREEENEPGKKSRNFFPFVLDNA
jgi:hypothetical protein